MARTFRIELPTDTGQFTALQFQPTAIAQLTFNAAWGWLAQHFVSHRRGILEHQLGWVIVGLQIHYREAFGYFDDERIGVEVTGATLKKDGRLLVLPLVFTGAGRTFADVELSLFPIAVASDESLSARPSRIEGALLERLTPDERSDVAPKRVVPELLAELEARGRPLASQEQPFRVHRHLCEVADQWCFTALPGLAAGSRENLAMRHAAEDELLRRGLAEPMRRFDSELRAPYFFLDDGVVATTAYALDRSVVFVHRLLGSQGPARPHAIVVESY